MNDPEETGRNRQTMCGFRTMAPDPLDMDAGVFSMDIECKSFECRLSKEEIESIRTSIYLDSCNDDSDDEAQSDGDETMTMSASIPTDGEMHSSLNKRMRWLEDMEEDDRLSLSSTPEMGSELSSREQKRAKTSTITIARAVDDCEMEQPTLCF